MWFLRVTGFTCSKDPAFRVLLPSPWTAGRLGTRPSERREGRRARFSFYPQTLTRACFDESFLLLTLEHGLLLGALYHSFFEQPLP